MSTQSPLLALFKEQLETECNAIAHKHQLADRGHWLIYWYFMRLHDFNAEQVEEVFCDGGGDLGIDVIWIDDEQMVHFYQFKNPKDPAKGIPAGDVDKVISGWEVILSRKHDAISNEDVRDRLEEIRSQVPVGYRLHLVSSGGGVVHETQVKLDALAEKLNKPSGTLFKWDCQPLAVLQEKFYQQNLPAVNDPIVLDQLNTPYTARSGVADCYLFHLGGNILASLYSAYGEGLLQRNIRVDQGDTATNRSIETTCTGSESNNFLHFNNGVTFLCEKALYDPFKKSLTLTKAQVVNGGQTIRALHRAREKGSLQNDVWVTARAIASSGEKDFANSVAVNQNNQNQLGAGFLRSTDQRVVQLDHALAAHGWYLERREGEFKATTAEEKALIQARIGGALDGRVIRLKEAAQAYTATFYGQPEIAKKNPAKMFLSANDGGYFERIFSPDMTAEKVIIAHELKAMVDEFVRRFPALWRKAKLEIANRAAIYEPLLGRDLSTKYTDRIHQVMPQCSLFLCGTIFKDLVELQKRDPKTITATLVKDSDTVIQQHLMHILDFAQNNPGKADRSWPTLLKSNAFFNHVISYLSGIRDGGSALAATAPKQA